MSRRFLLPSALLATLLGVASATAEDELRPSAGTPFSARHAFTQDRDELQLEGTFGWERQRNNSNGFEVAPGLRYGLTRNLELRFGAGYTFGDASGLYQGTLAPGIRYRLNDEGRWLPAFAFLAEVDLPFGAGDRGVATELTAIASKTTGRGPGAWGVHVNAGWLARPEPGAEERHHRYRFTGAVSHVVGRNTVLVGGYLHEQQESGERDLSVIEAGFQQRLGGGATLSAASGAGLNRDSPSFQLLVNIKYSFDLGRR